MQVRNKDLKLSLSQACMIELHFAGCSLSQSYGPSVKLTRGSRISVAYERPGELTTSHDAVRIYISCIIIQCGPHQFKTHTTGFRNSYYRSYFDIDRDLSIILTSERSGWRTI